MAGSGGKANLRLGGSLLKASAVAASSICRPECQARHLRYRRPVRLLCPVALILALGIPGVFLQLVGILFFPFAILAFFLTVACLICGHLSLGEIKRKSALFTGKSMAVTGLCLGYSAILIFVAYVVLAAVIFGAIAGEFKKTQFKTPGGKARMSTPAKHRSPTTP